MYRVLVQNNGEKFEPRNPINIYKPKLNVAKMSNQM